jgi:diguanylate cyclase (GGDEF)-like protein
LLIDRLGQSINACKRARRFAALIFLDLDNFKPLNDLHGHGAGDLLLREVARRLKTCVRKIDTISRYGGDEFVVLLSDLEADEAQSTVQAALVAEKIRLMLAEPYCLLVKSDDDAAARTEHRCSASIGVVVFGQHETSLDDIVMQADSAMYAAKEAGRNTIRFYKGNDIATSHCLQQSRASGVTALQLQGGQVAEGDASRRDAFASAVGPFI